MHLIEIVGSLAELGIEQLRLCGEHLEIAGAFALIEGLGVLHILREHGYALCLVRCGEGHEDLTDQFRAITREMGDVARTFGKDVLREVPEERFTAEVPTLRRACGDRAVLRAVHFFEEDSIKPEMVREPNLKDPKTGKPVKVGVEKQIEEHKEAAAVKKAKEEAKHGLDGQMDLFSFMEA